MLSVNHAAPRPSAVLRDSPPRSLRLPDLLHATDRAADAVLSGGYDHALPPGGMPTEDRWFTRIESDIYGADVIDIWLISWTPGHATELHDHAESLGALTVLSGSLDEFRWDGSQLKGRRLNAGDQAAFPLGWVHDVVWAPTPAVDSRNAPTPLSSAASISGGPTLSVHAYSPPLSAMSYYEVTDRNTLSRRRTELTDQPEGP